MPLAGPALADGVTAVTLLSGGLAEVTTRHAVTGDDSIRIVIPADQIDDILKSLVVRDPNGTVRGLRLDGPARAEATLTRLPRRRSRSAATFRTGPPSRTSEAMLRQAGAGCRAEPLRPDALAG